MNTNKLNTMTTKRTKRKPKTAADRIKHIELDVNRHGVAIAMAIDRIVQRLTAIESSVANMHDKVITETNAIDETVDRIETYLNKVGQAVVDQGREFKSKLSLIESSVKTETRSISDRLDALRFEQYALAQPKEDASQGLQPGDYCDASKEVADELTAMGFKPMTKESYSFNFIGWSHGDIIEGRAGLVEYGMLDATTFLSRARVTAKKLGLKPVDLAAEEARRKEAERAEKLAALKFGVRVMTPDGEAVYSCEVVAEHHHMVLPKGWTACKPFHIDDITILP
jgi:CRISPR/Cas system CSM-associated protein Csm2 small subunit